MSSSFGLNKSTNAFGQPSTLGGNTGTTAAPGSAFGGQQQQPQLQPTSSIFGTSPFSQPLNQNQNQNQNQPQTNASSFGGFQAGSQNNTNNMNTTSGLFSGTSPFSQSQNQNQIQNPNPSPISGLGSQTQQNVSPFSNLGGQTQNQNQPPPLFSGSGQNVTNTSTNPTSSLFSGGNPFTQPHNQNQNQSPFSGLGQTQTQNPLGLGGQNNINTINNSGPSMFSTTNSSTAGNRMFSSTALPSQGGLGTSAFGSKPPLSSSFFPGTSTSTSSQQNSQPDMQQRIEAIVAAWNPQSPQCRFQHYFYNLVDPRQVHLYGRPANATSDALWQQAVRENPNSSTMVPVLALGFDDLQKRVDAQSSQATQHHEKLKELQTRLSALSQTHILSNTSRTTRAMQTHMLITHRLLRLVEHIHLLIPSLRSAAISPEEEALRVRLERLRDELVSGASRGRLNELWALMGAVKAAREKEIGAGGEEMEWKVVDWEGLEKLAGILSEQQQGLAHLTSIINNGIKDLQVMEGSAPRNSESIFSASMSGSGMLGGR